MTQEEFANNLKVKIDGEWRNCDDPHRNLPQNSGDPYVERVKDKCRQTEKNILPFEPKCSTKTTQSECENDLDVTQN